MGVSCTFKQKNMATYSLKERASVFSFVGLGDCCLGNALVSLSLGESFGRVYSAMLLVARQESTIKNNLC